MKFIIVKAQTGEFIAGHFETEKQAREFLIDFLEVPISLSSEYVIMPENAKLAVSNLKK